MGSSSGARLPDSRARGADGVRCAGVGFKSAGMGNRFWLRYVSRSVRRLDRRIVDDAGNEEGGARDGVHTGAADRHDRCRDGTIIGTASA